MKFYLAGPMRGIPDNNRNSFIEAAERLRRIGHEVFSPAEASQADATDETFTQMMGELIPELLKCEAVVVLPAWGRSEGAKLEVLVALSTGKPVYAYHQHRPEVLEHLPNAKVTTRAEVING